MKRHIIITIAIFIFLSASAYAADMNSVMAWVAGEMKINIRADVQKPLIIRFSSKSCIKESLRSILLQTTSPLTSEALKNIEFNAQYAEAFYCPRANIIFIPSGANEGLLAHELCHYLQWMYRHQKNSFDAEMEAIVLERKYCREHGLPMPDRF